MKRKINILVLCFYLFYSLSPLVYYLGLAAPQEQAGTIFSSVHHSVPELDIPSLQTDDHASSTPGSYVLLKKKRAISIAFKILPQTPAVLSGLVPVVAASEKTLSVGDDRVPCPNGSRFHHSGTSPPSA